MCDHILAHAYMSFHAAELVAMPLWNGGHSSREKDGRTVKSCDDEN